MSLYRTDLPKPQAWPPPRDEDGIAAGLRYAREHDPVGDRVHLALALAHLVMLPLVTVGSSITFGLLAVYAFVRIPHTWRCYTALVRARVVYTLAAWTAWSFVSLAWSRDVAQGLDELGATRMILLPLLLWPLVERAGWLIAAALAGVAGQNVAQALQLLGWVDLRPQDEAAGRAGGWIHPIQTGAWCVAASCWSLAAILRGPGRARWLAVAGLGLAAAGLLVSQSRGPWLAAAVTIPLLLVVTTVRRPAQWRAALVLTLAGLAGAGAAWPIAGDVVMRRVDAATTEFRAARDHGIYDTHVGLRVGMWRWATSMYRSAPVIGLGMGSYGVAQAREPSFQAMLADNPGGADALTHAHPHNTPLHVLALTGTVGGLLALAFLATALASAWRARPDHPYAAGTFFVMVSWIIGAEFDAYHLNGHLLGLLMVAVAVSLRSAIGAQDASSRV
jgi:O-antigen ligase